MTIQTIMKIEANNNQVIELLQIENNYCVDSRKVAEGIGVQHSNFIETLRTYQEKLERWGVLPFETAKPPKGSSGGRPETYAMLNRNQALFAITLSRNTEQVVEWKMALIDALDQLDKYMKVKQIAKRPAPARRIAPPRPQVPLEEKIINKLAYLATIGIPEITPARLAGCYLKRANPAEVRSVMDTLVVSGKLVKVCSNHAPCGKYSLV